MIYCYKKKYLSKYIKYDTIFARINDFKYVGKI